MKSLRLRQVSFLATVCEHLKDLETFVRAEDEQRTQNITFLTLMALQTAKSNIA
jgi:hypothetical protein